MQRPTRVLVGVLTLVVGWLVAVTIMRNQPEPPADARHRPSPDRQMAADGDAAYLRLARDVAALKIAISKLGSAANDHQEAAPASSDGQFDAQPDTGLSPEMHDALMIDKALTTFDAMARHEPRDEAWATARETSIGEALARLSGTKLETAVCRETICKVDLIHESNNARLEFKQQAIGQSPFDTSCFFNSESDGKRTRLYCSREGHQLPRIEIEPQH